MLKEKTTIEATVIDLYLTFALGVIGKLNNLTCFIMQYVLVTHSNISKYLICQVRWKINNA